MAAKAFFLLRMNDHVQYLKKIQATLDNKGDFQGSDCHSCKLGVWLYGEGRSEVESLGAEAVAVFESLLEPHQQFHESGRIAVEKHVAADAAGREAAVTDMMRLSNTLVGKLLTLDRMAK